MKIIPVYTPLFLGNERKYLQKCIDSGWVSSDGYFVQKFEEEFAKWSGNKYAMTVCNGTAALETAIWSIKTTKYIYVPTNTIISCALAVLRNNKIPIFYYNNLLYSSLFDMNANSLLKCHPLLRCHLFGYFNNTPTITTTIDDASQYWKPFKVKDVACYSLYANKLITSGEGGIIVTNRKEIYERAKLYRNLCHSNERFIHNDIGYNFRMSNLQGAVALAQLEQIDKFTEIKQQNRDLYKKYLPNNVKFLADVEVPWMYLIETKFDARKVINKLKEKSIDCRRFFYPLHRQPCFNGKYEYLNFPNSDYAWKYWLYLPSGLTLKEWEIKYICKSLGDILSGHF